MPKPLLQRALEELDGNHDQHSRYEPRHGTRLKRARSVLRHAGDQTSLDQSDDPNPKPILRKLKRRKRTKGRRVPLLNIALRSAWARSQINTSKWASRTLVVRLVGRP